MDPETWRDVEGYNGRYQVSDLGRVKNTKTGRVLKPGKKPKGYLFVVLCVGGRGKTRTVHRLVAQAFIPNPRGLTDVDHANNVRTDNSVTNLRWASKSENVRNQCIRQGTSSRYKGVSWNVKNQKWYAQITFESRRHHLGTFADERDAAIAYNSAATLLFGDFARLNLV
jgi:hypothetical protein